MENLLDNLQKDVKRSSSSNQGKQEPFIRNSLYPVCVKSGMGCVIVEGDSIALFTAFKILQEMTFPAVYKPLIKLIKSVSSSLQNGSWFERKN